MADTAPNPEVATFLACQHVSAGDRGELTLAGIIGSLAINPDTGFTERFTVAIEFLDAIRVKTYFEIRIVKDSDPDQEHYRAAATFDPAKLGIAHWLTLTVPSLVKKPPTRGEEYSLELWLNHGRLAARTFPCVVIEDSILRIEKEKR